MIEFLDDTHLIWDVRVAIDQFLGAMGAGLLLAAIMIRKQAATAKLAATLAAVVTVVGLLALFTELGNPLAMYNMMFGNPGSVMFLGGAVQGAFVLVAVLFAASYYGYKFVPEKLLVVAGVVLAVLLGAYHGLLQSVLVARPVWNSALLPVISVIFGLTSGIALAMALSSKAADETDAVMAALAQPFKWLIIGQVVALLAMGVQVAHFSPGYVAESGGDVLTKSGLFWLGAVIIGAVLPALAVFTTTAADLKKRTAVITVLVLVGAFAYRYVLLQVGSHSVVFNLPFKFIE